MSSPVKLPDSMREVQGTARYAARSRPVVALARLGYAVKGVVYMVISVLAILLATGHGGQVTDQNGALEAIYDSPPGPNFGRFLLIVVTIGLFGFALWSFIQALLNTEGKPRNAKGMLARVGYAIVGISYGLLGAVAFQVASTGSTSRNSTSSTQNWTALLLKQPGGVFLVVLLGVIVLCIAAYVFNKAYNKKFVRRLNLSTLNVQTRQTVINIGRFGYAAIGVVSTIIGIFLIVAAVQHDPSSAKGLDSALVELLRQPFGPWLLGLVALGLLAYGVYSFVEARYRRVG